MVRVRGGGGTTERIEPGGGGNVRERPGGGGSERGMPGGGGSERASPAVLEAPTDGGAIGVRGGGGEPSGGSAPKACAGAADGLWKGCAGEGNAGCAGGCGIVGSSSV